MPLIVKGNSGDRISMLAPMGLQPAVCCDVVDRGFQDNKFQPGKKIQKVSIHWLISEKIPEIYTHTYTNERTNTGELAGKPFMVSRWFTMSLHEKASLRGFLRAWRGRDFTQEQLAGFDLETLLGVPCALNISHSQSESGTWYANVEQAMLLPQGMQKVEAPADYVRFKDREGAEAPTGEPAQQEPPPVDDDEQDIPF